MSSAPTKPASAAGRNAILGLLSVMMDWTEIGMDGVVAEIVRDGALDSDGGSEGKEGKREEIREGRVIAHH